jgi:hypothetical protein
MTLRFENLSRIPVPAEKKKQINKKKAGFFLNIRK